jgi:hypothetical protein
VVDCLRALDHVGFFLSQGRRIHGMTNETPYFLTRYSTMPTILIIVLILFFVGALPVWPHSKSWGYYPTGGLGLVLTILIILLLLGRI